MTKPWKESYLGMEYDHPAREHWRKAHAGLDPWFMGPTPQRVALGLFLGGLLGVCLGSSFLMSIRAVTIAGITVSCFFGLFLCTRDDKFERSIKEVEGLLHLTKEKPFGSVDWATLQKKARVDLEGLIRVWRSFVRSSDQYHPCHRWVDDLEFNRQDIRKRYQLFTSLGLVPEVPLGEDMEPSDHILVLSSSSPRAPVSE